MNAPRLEPLELITEEPVHTVGVAKRARAEMLPQHRAWISRKRKERVGIPLGRAEILQHREQLEDL